MSLGFAAAERLVGGPAFSALFELDPRSSVQAFFSINSTSPFLFGMAGVYKHTMIEHQSAGLHIGGGLGLGTGLNPDPLEGGKSAFAFRLAGLAGLHLPFPGLTNVMLHL